MKRFTVLIPSIILSILLVSCLKEENIDLAKPATFTRYYSDGYNNTAVAIERTKDGGYIILANSVFRKISTDPDDNHIVVIRTNAYGDLLWRKYYPDVFPVPPIPGKDTIPMGYKANSLTFLPDSSGYLIVGQNIEDKIPGDQGTINSELLVFTISDIDGSQLSPAPSGIPPTLNPKIFNTSSPNRNWNGKAGRARSGGTFLFLAEDDPKDEIILGELNPSLDTIWTRTYSQGTVSPANKLFLELGSDPSLDVVVFGSSGIQSNSTSDLAFTASYLDKPGTITGLLPVGTSNQDEFISDICRIGNNYAFTGYSSASGGNIIFYKVDASGAVSNSFTYEDEIFNGKIPPDHNTQLEKGNSITSTRDGGLIILGTIETYAGDILGRGDTDLILMKINGVGGKQWSVTYGSKDSDEGSCIRQVKDGGYLVLGTTTVGNLKTISLIKTDSKGNINPE